MSDHHRYEGAGRPVPLAPHRGNGGSAYAAPDKLDVPATPGTRLKRYLAITSRYRWAALLVFCAILGFTAYRVHNAVPQYSAVATVRVVADAAGAGLGGVEGAVMKQVLGGQSNAVLTDVHLLKSRPVLGEVVDSSGFRLQNDTRDFPSALLEAIRVHPDARARTLRLQFSSEGVVVRDGDQVVRAAYGEPVRLDRVSFTVAGQPPVESAELSVISREAAIGALSYTLSARPRPSTEILDLEVVSPDPHTAQRVANASADVYRDFNQRKAREETRRRRLFIEEQSSYVDSLQRAAQAALGAFRQNQQVFSSRASFEAVQGGIIELETQRENLDADRKMYRQLLAALQDRKPGTQGRELQTILTAPGVVASPVVSQLFGQLMEYEVTRDTLISGRWGRAPTHPDVQRQEVLIENTEARLVSAINSLLQTQEARLSALDALIAQKGGSVSNLTGPEAEELRLMQHVELMAAMSVKLGEEYQKARIAEAVEDGDIEIVEYAMPPTRPVGTSPTVKLLIGFVLALVGGVGSAVVLQNLNTSITRREDIKATLQLPDLAVIPQIPNPGRSGRRIRLPGRVVGNGSRSSAMDLVAVSDAYSPGAEAYRELRTRLLFSGAARTNRLVVTSATPGEGKSTTAVNLAVTCAQQGMRVLLIDCDLRRPRLHQAFGIPASPGAAEAAMGRAALEDVLHATSVEGLYVLPSGRTSGNPSELLGRTAMLELLDLAAERFDLVLLDTPPVLAVSDAAILAAHSDGVLFVVRAGQTDRDEAQLAVQKLESVGARIVGAVLNDPDSRAPQLPRYYAYHDAKP